MIALECIDCVDAGALECIDCVDAGALECIDCVDAGALECIDCVDAGKISHPIREFEMTDMYNSVIWNGSEKSL